MVVLITIRDDNVRRYLRSAMRQASSKATWTVEQETDLLRQTVAICESQVGLAPTYPLPPENAPMRAALESIVQEMRRVFYPGDRFCRDDVVRNINVSGTWNQTRRCAETRLASLASVPIRQRHGQPSAR